MNPHVLFVIDTDPRTSPRPAEAIRIAAGVGAWKKVDVSIYLRGAAILVLSGEPEGLIDEENFTRFLPLLKASAHPIYVEEDAPQLGQLGESALAFTAISDEDFASLAARQTYLLRF